MKRLSIIFIILFFACVGISKAQTQCTYSFDPQLYFAAKAGETRTATVYTQPNCVWDAVGNFDWITISGANHGVGTGDVIFVVAPNTGVYRVGSLTVAGINYSFAQDGIPCSYSFNPTPYPVPAAGGLINYNITKNGPDCGVNQLVSFYDWIHGTSIDPNYGPARYGEARFYQQQIGERVEVGIYQDAACDYSFDSVNQDFSASGGSGKALINLSRAPNMCQQIIGRMFASAAWITFNNLSNPLASTTNFTVAPNPTASPRTATVTAQLFATTYSGLEADRIINFTVTQAAPESCQFSLSPSSADFTSAAAAGSLYITTPTGCAWTAVASEGWLAVTNNSNGTGGSGISYIVEANTGAARTATITVGGQTFTVNQAAYAKSRKRARVFLGE